MTVRSCNENDRSFSFYSVTLLLKGGDKVDTLKQMNLAMQYIENNLTNEIESNFQLFIKQFPIVIFSTIFAYSFVR
jgi:hypothetical protein